MHRVLYIYIYMYMYMYIYIYFAPGYRTRGKLVPRDYHIKPWIFMQIRIF